MLFDLHVHSNYSPCGRVSPEGIVVQAARSGLDGVAVTDHDSMAVRRRLREGVQPNGLTVVFGLEYSTSQGDFLVFALQAEILPPLLSAPELLARVRDLGGVAVAAHPFRRVRPADESILKPGLCPIVEGVNGRNTAEENEAAYALAERRGLALVGGSDGHTLDEIGRVATRFEEPIRSRLDLIAALKSGRFRPEVLETASQTGLAA